MPEAIFMIIPSTPDGLTEIGQKKWRETLAIPQTTITFLEEDCTAPLWGIMRKIAIEAREGRARRDAAEARGREEGQRSLEEEQFCSDAFLDAYVKARKARGAMTGLP